MHPVLLKLGRFEIHSYGVMLAISFLVGIYWMMARAQKKGLERNHIMDLSLIVVFCAIFGSRALYVFTHVEEFQGHWLDAISPFQSSGEIGLAGLSMLGGVVLSIVAILVFCWLKKINIFKLCDVFAPAFALGIFLTRIGCFLNGCCFGKECSLPWAVAFPVNSPAGFTMQGMRIHPTQIYSSLYGLLILGILLLLDKKQRFDGFIMSVFFILYGLARFLVDYVRYYEESVQFPVLGSMFTINQIISFFMILTGFVIILIRHKKRSA